MHNKHLFLGFEVNAPWPLALPSGRILQHEARHVTVAFFGELSFSELLPSLEAMPKPNWSVGTVGVLDELLFLPPHHARVAAYHVKGQNIPDPFLLYQKKLSDWLREEGFELDRRDFLPHVTIARAPFHVGEWRAIFAPLPYYTGSLNLYQSSGNAHYEVIWSYEIAPPFTEIEHVADIAFQILGEKESDIHLHAQIALAFQDPKILPYLQWGNFYEEIPAIVMDLNDAIAKADRDVGLYLKAVSYHGHLQRSNELLSWEMIVDV